jgi:hypothetical protein
VKEYQFTLRFVLPTTGTVSDDMVERLGDAGCDDALVGVGQAGRIALEFARSSESAHAAILNAIQDVRRALPKAELVEAAPDIVGLTDIARMVGCSRQNMRKLLIACILGMPAPIHEGTPSLWHLAPVLKWLAREKRYVVAEDLLEVAEAAMQVNAALGALRTDDQMREEIRALLA